MCFGKLSHLISALLVLCFSVTSHAQDAGDYPNRPIRVIVPVGAGAGMDNAARVTAAAVEKHIGQTLVIENKPGAGSRIGAAMVAKAQPDGYTLLFTSPSVITVALTDAPSSALGGPPSIRSAVNGLADWSPASIPESLSDAVAVRVTGLFVQPAGFPTSRVTGSVRSTRNTA